MASSRPRHRDGVDATPRHRDAVDVAVRESRRRRSTQVDNRVFALIVFGMYCVTVFFIILSMFFAMVSAAQARTRVFSAQTRPRPPRDRIERAADRERPQKSDEDVHAGLLTIFDVMNMENWNDAMWSPRFEA